MFRKRAGFAFAAVLSIVFLANCAAYAHVGVRPKESAAGGTQKYTMRVPNEKTIPTVRIEAELPDAVEISAMDELPDWKLEQKKNASGKIVGAIWSGSTIAPGQFVQITFEARNPSEPPATLVWKVVQIFEDGSRMEWTGPQGSRTPAAVTIIKALTTEHKH